MSSTSTSGLDSAKVGLHMFHVLGVVPFFFYVSIVRSTLPEFIFNLLIGLGAILIIYHGYKSVLRWYSGSTYIWVNAIHAIIIGPLLLYIGIHKKTTPRAAYEALMLVAFGAFGYHLKLLAEDLNWVRS